MSSEPSWHSTTILAVKKGRKLVVMGDGQVSMGDTVMKGNARQGRGLFKERGLAGFAGGTAGSLFPLLTLLGEPWQQQRHLTPAPRRDGDTGPDPDPLPFRLVARFPGAAGNVLDVFFQQSKLDRKAIVATKAVTQAVAHALRVAYFGSFAEAFATPLPWWLFAGAIALALLAGGGYAVAPANAPLPGIPTPPDIAVIRAAFPLHYNSWIAITRRFMVVEPLTRISARVMNPAQVSKIRTHQEIDFTVDYERINLRAPQQEVQAVVLQNGRWDNAVTGIPPMFVRKDQLVFDFQDKIVFPGGKEFRFFDFRLLRSRMPGVATVEQIGKSYEVVMERSSLVI